MKIVFTLAVGLILASVSNAQNGYSTMLTGVKPSDVTFKPVSINNSAVGSAASDAATNRFSLSGIFRSLKAPSISRITGSSGPVPYYSSPYQPAAPVNSTVPLRR